MCAAPMPARGAEFPRRRRSRLEPCADPRLVLHRNAETVDRVVVCREVDATVRDRKRGKVRERRHLIAARPELLARGGIERVEYGRHRLLRAYVGLIQTALFVVRLANPLTGAEREYDAVGDCRKRRRDHIAPEPTGRQLRLSLTV